MNFADGMASPSIAPGCRNWSFGSGPCVSSSGVDMVFAGLIGGPASPQPLAHRSHGAVSVAVDHVCACGLVRMSSKGYPTAEPRKCSSRPLSLGRAVGRARAVEVGEHVSGPLPEFYLRVTSASGGHCWQKWPPLGCRFDLFRTIKAPLRGAMACGAAFRAVLGPLQQRRSSTSGLPTPGPPDTQEDSKQSLDAQIPEAPDLGVKGSQVRILFSPRTGSGPVHAGQRPFLCSNLAAVNDA